VELREGDLFTPISESVDVVVANLPYLRDDYLQDLAGDRTSLAFEPRVAVTAGRDGLGLIQRAAAELPRVLARGGEALFEIDPSLAGQVANLLRHFTGGETRIIRDLAGDERVVAVQTQ
jgi:release factor glutamine methyltransferase